MDRPAPYNGKTSPFPLPVGKRSLGGWAALEERDGTDLLSEMFQGVGRPEPAPLGKTRCYWALLASHSSTTNPYDLTFVYCDPVLQSHLGTEADHLIGKSFFDWVHPAEKERAQTDLQTIVTSRTLFGSVTRCRYTRVPAIRKVFGNPNPPIAPESHMYVDDDLWLPIDVVLNMVGDSLALCFFHAIINKSVHDNDEVAKTDWTNWCGRSPELFDAEQCHKLWSYVQSTQMYKRPSDPAVTPPYVFQILTAPPADETPEILFSWPPPRLYRKGSRPGSRRDEASFQESFEDGSYFADEFARLAQGIRTAPSARTEDGSAARNGDPGTIEDGANTSCTRRFRAKHVLTSEGMVRSIETVLVPYGAIMFACFGTMYQQTINHPASHASHGPEDQRWSPESFGAIAATPQDVHTAGLDGPARKRYKEAPGPAPAPAPTVPIDSPEHRSPPHYNEHGRAVFTGPAVPRELHDHDRAVFAAPTAPGQTPFPHQSPTRPTQHVPFFPRGPPPSAGSPQYQTMAGPVASSFAGHVRHASSSHDQTSEDASPRRGSPATSIYSSGTDGGGGQRPGSSSFSGERSSLASSSAAAALFAETHPENGEKRCTSCGTSESPEWRKGPTGQKSLCNACGLRFSRSVSRRQKKEAGARPTAQRPTSSPASGDGSSGKVKRTASGAKPSQKRPSTGAMAGAAAGLDNRDGGPDPAAASAAMYSWKSTAPGPLSGNPHAAASPPLGPGMNASDPSPVSAIPHPGPPDGAPIDRVLFRRSR
ncbi:unnamed protein product [Parajaminaea phylloscopi]